MPTENRSRNEQKMVSAPKFYPIDAINAYPEPVGTNDRLEHHDGAVWVHLNGKRSKLVGMQSLVFLIGNLQAIHADVFGPEAAQPQGEPVARVEIGADRNAALTVTDENWLRSLKEKGHPPGCAALRRAARAGSGGAAGAKEREHPQQSRLG